MEVLIYIACLILIVPYALMAYASFKIYKDIKAVLNTSKDNLDFPSTL